MSNKEMNRPEAGTIGTANLEEYMTAVDRARNRAEEFKVETTVNYIPLQNTLLLRGSSLIRKSDLLRPKIQDVFKEAIAFRFEVVATGPDVKNVKIGDIVDIKNTSGLSVRPFIPDNNNIGVWRARLKKDRDAMIRHGVKSSEDAKHAGSPEAAMYVEKNNPIGGNGTPKLEAEEETVTIVEYFATEDYNLSGIYYPVERELDVTD